MGQKAIDIAECKTSFRYIYYFGKNVLKKFEKRVLTPKLNGDIISFAHGKPWVTSLKKKIFVDKNSMKNNFKKDEKSC